jgi:hypothetical protein
MKSFAILNDGIETIFEWVIVSGLLQGDSYTALNRWACQLRSNLNLAARSLQ